MLLWVLILSAFGSAVAMFGGNLPPGLRARALAIQGMIAVGFYLFLLLTSNPFERVIPPPLNGNDLNPLLQDFGLAIHPPMLYLGYVHNVLHRGLLFQFLYRYYDSEFYIYRCYLFQQVE